MTTGKRTYCVEVDFDTCSAHAVEVDAAEADAVLAIGTGALASSTNDPCEAAKDALGSVMPEDDEGGDEGSYNRVVGCPS